MDFTDRDIRYLAASAIMTTFTGAGGCIGLFASRAGNDIVGHQMWDEAATGACIAVIGAVLALYIIGNAFYENLKY
jgi:hypothetical protein